MVAMGVCTLLRFQLEKNDLCMGLRKLFCEQRSSTCVVVLSNRFETGPNDFPLLTYVNSKMDESDMYAGVQAVLRRVLEKLLAGSYGADAVLEGGQYAKEKSH